MEIDWKLVKKKTLWDYDDLVGKLLEVLAYDLVNEHYNHTMAEAIDFAAKVQVGYLRGRSEALSIQMISANFQKLNDSGIGGYLDLVRRVESKEKCTGFLTQTGFSFEDLIEILNYLFRLVLPFKFPLRELFDLASEQQNSYYELTKREKLRSNLDILEKGRKTSGRAELCASTGIPAGFIESLVHKADISRLAYVRGKTVMHLCGGGYDTLGKIAGAELAEMEKAMEAYYKTLGKRLSDFQAVIPLDWMIGGAQILPRVVEVSP